MSNRLVKNALENYKADIQTLAACLAEELGFSFQKWSHSENGGYAVIGPYSINSHDIINYFRLGFTPDEFAEWHNHLLDSERRGVPPISMYYWSLGDR